MDYLQLVLFLLALVSYSLTDVVDLNGKADFRWVKLRWKYRRDMPDVTSFVITYCENQAWGKYRCRNKLLNPDSINSIHESDREMTYEATIHGLRLATNYTVEVSPYFTDSSRMNPQRARALGSHLWIQTKGFFAHSINCLTDKSLIEIETGPYFGGKISVEGSTDSECSTQGDGSSNKTIYLLTIDHNLCKSMMNVSSVKSFVIVQENLPILTHSTRRFMVVCNYVPETFTVRAGVNLPDEEGPSENNLVPVSKDVFEVDPSELFDSSNNLFSSRVGKNVGRALRFSSDNNKKEKQSWAYMVLMVVFMMLALIGVTCAVGYFIRNTRFRSRNRLASSSTSSTKEPSVTNINSNMDSQDILDGFSDSVSRINMEESIASLTSFNSLADQVTVVLPPDVTNQLESDASFVGLVVNDLHPLNFELDDPVTLMTNEKQPLPVGSSNLISHQIILKESSMPVFMSSANITSLPPYPLIPNPTLVPYDEEEEMIVGDELTCTEEVMPTIILPGTDSIVPCPDGYEDMIFPEGGTASSGRYERETNENFDPELNLKATVENLISESKSSPAISTEGVVDINWQFKDENGVVHPSTAV